MPFQGTGPLANPPPRALFHSVHSLLVTRRTQFVINTLSCCSSVTVLMAPHSGSLGYLLCLNIRMEVASFYFLFFVFLCLPPNA